MKSGSPGYPAAARLLGRAVEVEAGEFRALLWSCAYFFFVLSSYYVIRPLREQMAVAGGTRNIPWLFTASMISMLIVHPPFAALVARLPRRTFVPIANRFFAANLVIFFVVLKTVDPVHQVWVGRVFFVWTAVFNLFVISVFWSVMADVFTNAQGKRLFGFIGCGGTLGGIAGSVVTAVLAPRLGAANLIVFSIVLLELGTLAVGRLSSVAMQDSVRAGRADGEAVIGGGILDGMRHAVASPYLLGISAYMLLYTIGSTTLYLAQAEIADGAFTDSGARTSFFARIDLAVNILTFFTQVFLTGRLVRVLGVGVTLTLLPAISVIGFIALGAYPVIAVFVVFQVLRRAGEFAVARPTREVLYTVVPRDDKYKAKHFIDTFVYRLGDQIGAWATSGYRWLGVGLSGESFLAVPLMLSWLGIGLWLGRQQETAARVSGN
ncbi:MAG: NTP/NDP exchange transporter [Gemmatimonadota bacterium]